jgi:hypothetical protein
MLRRMWPNHQIREIALAMKCSGTHVSRLASRLGLPKKSTAHRGSPPDPPPEEVLAGSTTIRAGWSKAKRKRRSVVKTPEVSVRTLKIR